MKQTFIRPPTITRRKIIEAAEGISRRYFHVVGLDRIELGISFDSVYEHLIYPEYEIDLIEDEDLGYDPVSGEKIFGRYDPTANEAFVDPCLRNDPRRTFTLWHEVGGHGILQGEWLRQQIAKNESVCTTATAITPQTEDVFEKQANLFAGHAAAPRWLVEGCIQKTFGLPRWQPYRFIGPGRYTFALKSGTLFHYCDTFSEVCLRISQYIRWRFGRLSFEALSYQVAQCGMVVDKTARSESPSLHRTETRAGKPVGVGPSLRRVDRSHWQRSGLNKSLLSQIFN